MTAAFKGVFPPVPTIVNEQGELDRPCMARMLDHVIANGADGVLILGSGGEFSIYRTANVKRLLNFVSSI